jgi:apolipoprotein D and lipocalin family protein
MKLILIAALNLFSRFCFAADPAVVPNVDLQRYSGLWYQVAHFPSFFLKNCERSTAEYSLNADGTIAVLNKCYKNNLVKSSIQGTASAPNPSEPTKLKVDFGFFAKGDYWIIALDEDYQWAVVSGPGKSSLFVLSRQGPMDGELLKSIVQKLADDGFDTAKIIYDKY